MTTVATAELTSIRDEIDRVLLPDTCNILSGTQAPDNYGGVTITWGTATASGACRLDNLSGIEKGIGGGIVPYSRWVLTLTHDATITTENRVEHGGLTYAVTSVNTDQSWIMCKRCEVQKL